MDKNYFNSMIEEFRDLNNKTLELRNFILDEEKFNKLDLINKDLLIAQLKAMETYLSVLSIRLGLNGANTSSDTKEETSENLIETTGTDPVEKVSEVVSLDNE